MQESELAVYEVGGCAVAGPAGYVYAVEALVEEGSELGQFGEDEVSVCGEGKLEWGVCFETES